MSAKCQKRTYGCQLFSAARPIRLNRWAGHSPVGAKHAAVPRLGTQNLTATVTWIETNASVRGIVSVAGWPQWGQVIVVFHSMVALGSSIVGTP